MGTIIPHKQEIVDLYKSGWSCAAIGRKLAVQTTAVSMFLNRNGIRAITTAGHKTTDAQQIKIAEMYASGIRSSVIGKKFGVHQCTVREIAIRHGVPAQSVGVQKRVLSAKDVELVKNLWQHGASCEQIGKRISAYPRIISRELRKAGLSLRGRGVPRKERATLGYYYTVYVASDHPYAEMANGDGRVLEHRLRMAEKLGRPLTQEETVHHIDNDKKNNDIKNLQLRQGKHGKHSCYACGECGSRNVVSIPIDDPAS